MSKPGSFSSQSVAPAGGRSKAPQSNSTLDPKDQTAKNKEKDQMVGLNDKFIAFIDKVKHLEDQNNVLSTRLRILKEQQDYQGKVEEVVQRLREELLQQIDGLARDRLKLESELAKNQDELEHTRKDYEDEYQKKMELENDFVINKKDVDEGHLAAVDLALELEDLMGELDFLRRGYEEEVKELLSQVQNQTVMVKESNRRALDMDDIIDNAKAQYVAMATRSREEAEHWNQKKMDSMVQTAGKHEQDVREVKNDIADLQRLIKRLKGELEALTKTKGDVEKDIEQEEEEGQRNLQEAKENLRQLEDALRRAKQDMARQVREYQALMNLKLALDIEIATYRKLLEGEEMRMNQHMRPSDY